MIVVKYEPTANRHLVDAAGGPGDGSLYGFSTLCGQQITELENWREEDTRHPHRMCKRCIKAEQVRLAEDGTRELQEMCRLLIADVDERPGAYIHADTHLLRRIRAALAKTGGGAS